MYALGILIEQVFRCVIMNQKISKHDYLVFAFVAFYLIGYFGLFSILSVYVPRILIYFTLLFMCVILFHKDLISGIKNYKKEYFNDTLSIVVVMIIIFSLMSLLIKSSIGSQSSTISYPKETALMVFTALFFSPLSEELVNRCAIKTVLEKITKNGIAIYSFSAVLFTFLHLYKMDAGFTDAIFHSLIYFSLGYICMYQYRKFENIVIPISIHFFWNAFILIGSLLTFIA